MALANVGVCLLLASSAGAAGSAAQLKPGYRAGDVHGKRLPPRAGSPRPERLRSARADHCSGKEQPGTLDLLRFLERWWPRGESWGIYSCRLPSLHSEGRALDYHLDVRSRRDLRAGREIKRFFTSKDTDGARFAMARRFGIQEIIFDCRVWGAARADKGWRRYYRCDWPSANRTHRHEDHIHIGQSWAGAERRTTAWTGFRY